MPERAVAGLRFNVIRLLLLSRSHKVSESERDSRHTVPVSVGRKETSPAVKGLVGTPPDIGGVGPFCTSRALPGETSSIRRSAWKKTRPRVSGRSKRSLPLSPSHTCSLCPCGVSRPRASVLPSERRAKCPGRIAGLACSAWVQSSLPDATSTSWTVVPFATPAASPWSAELKAVETTRSVGSLRSCRTLTGTGRRHNSPERATPDSLHRRSPAAEKAKEPGSSLVTLCRREESGVPLSTGCLSSG